MPLVSIIVPCKNEGENILNTVKSFLKARTKQPYEIIVVDDASTDGCTEPLKYIHDSRLRVLKTSGLGAPQARNFGAKHADGEIFIFCDAHVFVPDEWLEDLLSPLLQQEADVISPAISCHDNPKNTGYGQKLNEKLEVEWYIFPPQGLSEIAVSPGGCQAFTRNAFAKIGGYDSGFKIWGYEDIEISMKAWLFGLRLLVQPKVNVLHVFRPKHPYRVEFSHVHYNLLRMAASHFNLERYNKTLSLIKDFESTQEIIKELNLSDSWLQRLTYRDKRVYDDDWFFNRFAIKF